MVGVAASPEDAARRVQAGEADGILDVTPEGWLSLVLPAGGRRSASRAREPRLGLDRRGDGDDGRCGGIGRGGEGGPLLLSTAIKRAMAERRERGQRVGPRPAKPSRRLTEEVVARQRGPGQSLRAIADSLNERDEPTLKGTGKWHPASVKRLIDGSRAETRIVLRRLAGLLGDLQQRQPVDDDELARLGGQHGFHHHRLWLAFEREARSYFSGLIPPVEKTPGGYVVSEQGAELLRIWKRSEELDDTLEALCLALEEAGGAVDPQASGAMCAKRNLDASDVPSSLVDYDAANGRFTLTADGRDIAQVWRRLASSDPRERLDIDFWPEAHEEEQLPPTGTGKTTPSSPELTWAVQAQSTGLPRVRWPPPVGPPTAELDVRGTGRRSRPAPHAAPGAAGTTTGVEGRPPPSW